MKLNVCWMYHDLMDLYGDKGNIMVLEKRCKDRGIEINIDTCGIDEENDLKDYHLVFLGGGADKEQALVMKDLLKRKQNIQEAMDLGTFFFLICGGYQVFGQYYTNTKKEKIEGLKFFDYYSESVSEQKRCTGNIIIKVKLEDEEFEVVGFENHGGHTHNVNTPFGTVVYGKGNNDSDKTEGFMNDQVIGTYIHGPLLPKNPKVADYIIYKSLKKEYTDLKLTDLLPLEDTLENQARSTMIKRIKG